MSTFDTGAEPDPETDEPTDGVAQGSKEIELEFTGSTLEDIDAYASHSGVSRSDAIRRIVRTHFLQTERRTIRLTAFTAGLAWVAAIGLFGATNVASIVGAIYIVVTLFWASYPLVRSA